MAADGDVGLAFGLVIGAGLCTTIGALLAFFVSLNNIGLLAGSLGLSAGVMMYVSFTEIFMAKGVAGFEDAGQDEDWALRYATIGFFGGILLIWCLDQLVHTIVHCSAKREERRASSNSSDISREMTTKDSVKEFTAIPSVSSDKGKDIEGGKGGAGQIDVIEEETVSEVPAPVNESFVVNSLVQDHHHAKDLKKMGLLTALAIFIHNLPEGLATFLAALASPVSGIAIAFAIAIHNIPEGICVAMPVYYATGSRWKGFLWAFLSGVSEPVGGLLGYFILYGDNMSDLAYGVLFTMVAGMMVYISVRELIPTALKYDPEDKYTTKCIFLGMLIMAASLLLFTI